MIRKGTYILIFDLPEMTLRVGALGILSFANGSYCYVGSAMNGLDQRISRHLSKNKKVRWHIDYLSTVCDCMEAYESEECIPECDLCGIVRDSGGTGAAKGFGCSDCGCPTHLFLLTDDAKEELVSYPGLTPHIG